MDIQLEVIRNLICEYFIKLNIRLSKIILFGSMAKQETKDFSDYDFLIITESNLKIRMKRYINSLIKKELAQILVKNGNYWGSDILIRSQKEIDKYLNKINTVTRTALLEGTIIYEN